MDEYLDKLLSQIRCKKARKYIGEEIKDHIEEQISDNMETGMERKQAEKAAVRDMGDPVEVGIAMDKIHRPQIAWNILILITLISLASIVIHRLIYEKLKYYNGNALVGDAGSTRHIFHMLFGLGIMFIIYIIDYTTIARYSKIIAIAIMVGCLFTNSVNGAYVYVSYGSMRLSVFSVMMLYVPIYGGVIYKYHGEGYSGLFKAIVWMLIPCIIAWRIPNMTLVGILFISMLSQLTIAVANNWFNVSKKKVIVGLWTIGTGLPALSIAFMYYFKLLKTYQLVRINSFFTNSGSSNYLTNNLRELVLSSRLIGDSGKDVIGLLPNFDSDYILAYITSGYGILAGIIVCCILSIMIMMIFNAVIRQKNQVGMIMGCGCGFIFLINTAINILEIMGIIPVGGTFLPFFSSGGSTIILSYCLLGIVLSIYRYQSIYPSKINVGLPKIKMSIEL